MIKHNPGLMHLLPAGLTQCGFLTAPWHSLYDWCTRSWQGPQQLPQKSPPTPGLMLSKTGESSKLSCNASEGALQTADLMHECGKGEVTMADNLNCNSTIALADFVRGN